MNSKIKLCLAIPANLALCNSETWSGNQQDLELLDVFHHRSIRRILNISMLQVKDERLKNSQVRKKSGNIKNLSEIWRSRLLNFAGRVARQPSSTLSRKSLSIVMDGNRSTGRPFRTNKDALFESLRLLIPSMPHKGNIDYWIGYASDQINWEKMVKSLNHKTYSKYNRNNDSDNNRSRNRNNSPPKSNTNHNHNPPSPPSISPPRYTSSNRLTRSLAYSHLSLPHNATRREIITQFRILSRTYHPDKWNTSRSFTKAESVKKFQMIANTK